MITLYTPRQFAEAAVVQLFPYAELLKTTRLNNVVHHDAMSEAFLSVLSWISTISEIQKIFKHKVLRTKAHFIRFEFSDAQGVELYKMLKQMPIDQNHDYLLMVRADWLNRIGKGLEQLYMQNLSRISKVNAATTWSDYFEELP